MRPSSPLPLPLCSRRVAAAACAALVACAVAGVAQADPGDHIRAGEAVITPSLDIGLEYTSNAYRAERDPVGGANLALVPRLEIQAEGPDVAFTLDGNYQLRKYFAERLTNLDRYSDFGIGGKLELLKQNTLGFELDDDVSLRNRATDRPGADVAYYTQFRNQLQGAAVIRPGPVLSFDLGGSWVYSDFFVADFTDQGIRPFNFRHSYGPTLDGEWTFLPRTDLVISGGYTWNRWAQNWVPTNNADSELGAFLGLPDSETWRATAGLRGRLTEKLVLVATAGYGQAVYDEQSVVDEGGGGDSLDAIATDLSGIRGLLITTQVAWEMAPGERIAVGYKRDFRDAWFTNFVTYDEVYTNVDLRFGTRLGTRLGGMLRFEDYDGEVDRNDLYARAEGAVFLELQDWARLSVGSRYGQRLSTGAQVQFQEVELMAGARFTY